MEQDKNKTWVFTFGVGQEFAGCYVEIKDTHTGSARSEMIQREMLELIEKLEAGEQRE